MKISFLKYVVLLFVTASIISCEKNTSTTTAPTLDAFLASEPRLSVFASAINKAGLESFKNGPGPFTWFAPTNDAFTAAGISGDSLAKMTVGQVNYLLQYHLVNADLNGENMIAINSSPRATQLGTGAAQIYIGSVNGENYVNGTKIISRDNKVSNGQVHIINKLVVPPVLRGNIQGILTATNQNTLFIQALTKANLWTSFGGTPVYTVFAPTDAAMTAAGYTSASIAAANVTTLASAMRYHYILNLRLFTNDLIRPSLPSTAAGSAFFITPSENGTKIKGKSNATPANIISPNNLGTNGVVHVIDGVLRP